jgi:hypothetical protein
VEPLDGVMHAKADPPSELVPADVAVGKKDQYGQVGGIGLTPAAVGAGPAHGPDATPAGDTAARAGSSTTATPSPKPWAVKARIPSSVAPARWASVSWLVVMRASVSGRNRRTPFTDPPSMNTRANVRKSSRVDHSPWPPDW